MTTAHEAAWEQRLRRALAAETPHEPLLLLIGGAAGTGKSRLVRRLLALPEYRAVPRLVVSFAADGDLVVQERDRPGVKADDAATASGRRPWSPISDASAGSSESSGPSNELAALVAAAQPALLIAEDVHRADRPSLTLLRHIVAHAPARFACILTYRPEELVQPGLVLGAVGDYPAELGVLRLAPPPLDLEHVQAMVAGRLGEDRCPTEVATRLLDVSGGVAQVVVDLVALLKDLDSTRERYSAKDIEHVGVPVRLAELVVARTATMAEQHRPIVWAAAVLAQAATARELAEVAGCSTESTREALLTALARAVLQEQGEGRYGFAVPLAASAIYATLPGPIRQELHRRAANALAHRQPVPWAQVAEHRRSSGQTRKWLHAVEQATSRCAELGAHQAAIGLLEATLASPAVPTEARARLAPILAHTAVVGLRSDQTVDVLQQIVDDKELPSGVRGEVRLDLGLLLGNQVGRSTDGWVQLRQAVDELQDRPALAARAMAALALPYWPATSFAENVSWIERAEVAAAESGDVVMQTAVAANRLSMLMEIGDPEAWRLIGLLPRDSEVLGCRQHAARGLCNAADAAVWLGFYQQAKELLADGVQLAARSGAPYTEQTGRGTLLVLDWATGRWSGLPARARAFVAESGEMPAIAEDARVVLGLLALARGEWGQVTTWLSGDHSPAPEEGAVPLVAAASGALIRLALARRDIEAAAELAVEAWARLQKKGVWAWGAELAPWAIEAVARAGQPGLARDMVAEFGGGLEGRGAPSASAALTWSHAVLAEALGQPEKAAALFREANAKYAILPRPYAAALMAEGTGRCTTAVNSSADFASTELATAEKQFDQLGAMWDAARVRATLRDHQPPSDRRRTGRPTYGEHLSPREQEVAQLAAGGLTNREIAATLHLSSRTVEQHVARAMNKLGAHSRKDLAKPQARHER